MDRINPFDPNTITGQYKQESYLREANEYRLLHKIIGEERPAWHTETFSLKILGKFVTWVKTTVV